MTPEFAVPPFVPSGESTKFHRYLEGLNEYTDLAGPLREEPLSKQAEFLELFLGPKGRNCPHYQDLVRLLILANNAHYLNLTQEPNAQQFQTLVDQYCIYYNRPQVPVRVVKDTSRIGRRGIKAELSDPSIALFNLGGEIGLLQKPLAGVATLIHAVATGFTYDAVGRPDWEEKNSLRTDMLLRAVNIITTASMWLIVSDRMYSYGYKGNPYLPLVEILNAGCFPFGIRGRGRNEFYVVYAPPIQ